MSREQFKVVEIARFECVSSTQNSCRKTMLNVESAIVRQVYVNKQWRLLNNVFICSRHTHINVLFQQTAEPTNGVCEYGPRSPTHFFCVGPTNPF